GRSNLLEGISPTVKSALTKAYKEGSKSRVVRTADMITLPGFKKAPKKRIAAILEPVDELGEVNGDINGENEEENTEDAEDLEDGNGVKNLNLDLEINRAKGIQVQVDLKDVGSSGTKKTQKSSSGRGKGGASEPASGKRGGRGSGAAAKRKR
ncbi:Replication factor C subunit 1, partial [Bienertia sinuspersici]